MIITRLKGGLGNQMFQYAAGLALSLHHNTELLVDGSFLYESDKDTTITPRRFELDCYGLHDNSLDHSSVRRIRRLLQSRPARVIKRIAPSLLPWNYFTEESFAYSPKIYELRGNVMLEGYWQSERYFKKYASQVATAFQLAVPLSERTLALVEKLESIQSVSVHIRRGDLIINPNAAAIHGLCSNDYYREALQRIKEIVPNVSVIVFSDEPNYVKQHMQFLNPEVIVDWNHGRNYEDMYLMKHCSHHILANSSFSWWGAWLNASSDKQVFAPSRWFKTSDLDTSSLIPLEWQQL